MVLVGFVVAIGPKVNQVMVGKCLPEMCRICAHVLEEICNPKMPAPGRPRGKADPLRGHVLLRRLSNCGGQWVCAKYLPQKSHRKIAILGAFRENRGRPTIIFAKRVFKKFRRLQRAMLRTFVWWPCQALAACGIDSARRYLSIGTFSAHFNTSIKRYNKNKSGPQNSIQS